MIYKNNKDWSPNTIPLGKQHLTVLNVSCLQNLQEQIQKRAKQLEKMPLKIKQWIQDAIIDTTGLKEKVDIVILPYSCFKRSFQPIYDSNLDKQQQITPYEHLVKMYGVQFPVGVSVPLDPDSSEYQDFISEYKAEKFKYNRAISFNLHGKSLQKELPIMRKIVKQTFNETKKIKCHYNINIQLKSASQFTVIREELLTNDYPIQYMAITHNLINLFSYTDQYLISNRINQIINRTLPCCLINVIETYYPSYCKQQTKFCSIQDQLQFFYKTVSIINKKNQSGQRSYRKVYNSGIAIPECIFAEIIMKFNLQQSDHFMVRAEMDRLAFNNANAAILGNYKSQKQANYN